MGKLVVTGALGHIGSRFIRNLPAHFPEREIVMIDNLSTQRYCSLFNLPETGRYRFMEDDILACDLGKIVEESDIVIHLAAITDAANSFSNQEQVREVNFRGTKIVADVCAERKARLIFPSTTSVYGTQKEEVDENCSESELQPQSPYARSKLDAEKYLRRLGEESGLDYVICRFGTILGTSIGMRFHTAVNKFCWQAVMGEPITVWRSALHQKRPYLDLGDAADALVHIMKKSIFSREIYNVLTVNTAVSEIVSIISGQIPGTKIGYVDSEIMNQLSYCVSNKKFIDTGYSFTGSLERNIHATLELLKNARTASQA